MLLLTHFVKANQYYIYISIAFLFPLDLWRAHDIIKMFSVYLPILESLKTLFSSAELLDINPILTNLQQKELVTAELLLEVLEAIGNSHFAIPYFKYFVCFTIEFFFLQRIHIFNTVYF